MKKFINKHTGSIFWVADKRVEEYKAAGHKLAANSLASQEPKKEIPVIETEKEVEEVKPFKKSDRKIAKKK